MTVLHCERLVFNAFRNAVTSSILLAAHPTQKLLTQSTILMQFLLIVYQGKPSTITTGADITQHHLQRSHPLGGLQGSTSSGGAGGFVRSPAIPDLDASALFPEATAAYSTLKHLGGSHNTAVTRGGGNGIDFSFRAAGEPAADPSVGPFTSRFYTDPSLSSPPRLSPGHWMSHGSYPDHHHHRPGSSPLSDAYTRAQRLSTTLPVSDGGMSMSAAVPPLPPRRLPNSVMGRLGLGGHEPASGLHLGEDTVACCRMHHLLLKPRVCTCGYHDGGLRDALMWLQSMRLSWAHW